MNHPDVAGRRKRVALLLSSLHGRGVQRIRLTLARAFAERGLEVDLVVADYSGAMASDIPAGVNVHVLNAPRMAGAILKLARYFRERRPDAVLSAQDHVNCAAILARKLSGGHFRLATSVHVMPADDAKRPFYTRSHWMPYVIGALYPFSDQVIAVSDDIAANIEEITGFPKKKVMVLHNPIDVQRTRERGAEPLDHPWFGEREIPVVIGVGALGPMKNFSVLVDAVAEVNRTRPLRLVLLGEGPRRAALEEQISRLGAGAYVQLPGYVPNPAAYMMRADALCLTSTNEPFGNVLTEALACGCPIVSVNCYGGPSEILDGGRYGALVEGYDPRDFAAAICRTLDRPRDSERLVTRAMDFDISKGAARYLQVLGLAQA